MIELQRDHLCFRFRDVHPEAELSIDCQRTLRIPDDGKTYPLPPGLGSFPLRHVDDFGARLPASWLEHGGVMLPMYQAEALWLDFSSRYVDSRAPYPFVIKIATGKINAVTGERWAEGMHRGPQDYMVAPPQPWLDGYCVEKGLIRQFVAMPLGTGYSAEEQLTGDAAWGGLQIAVCPMKREVFERRFPVQRSRTGRFLPGSIPASMQLAGARGGMGLAPGGRMRQEIYEDPFDLADWDLRHSSRCFVHLANSMVWRAVTGQEPPTAPVTAVEYERAGLPWFEYYGETPALEGAEKLAGLKSLAEMGKAQGAQPLPENESVAAEKVVKLRAGSTGSRVREW